ncbi:hypothetical protein R5R35_005064 [Gryllus longicercus]|uniref:Accessory gland protein n=1 Tax=Gryllus longicercus TaxID=2509291 RepID=A0AAN9VM35_9ORTH
MARLTTMMLVLVTALLALLAASARGAARPDSAGIVEMVNGLAYGGIPYGSVTGRVAEYYRSRGDPLGNSLLDDLLQVNNQVLIL